MRGLYNNKTAFLVYQLAFLLFIVFLCLYAAGIHSMSSTTIVLLASVLIVALTGILGGLLMSLGISLVALFLLGTVLIWEAYASSTMLLSLKGLIFWMVMIIVSSFISGKLHKWTTTVMVEHQEMRDKFDELVTIDEATGFDNQKRFYFEMEEEYRRSVRTGTPFSLLLIRIKYFEEFERLYGAKETVHLVKSLSDVLWTHTRIGDRKFRVDGNTFAVILFNTGEENADYVIDKLEEKLKHQTLEDGKKAITLTVSFGVASFTQEWNDYTELIRHGFQELEQHTQ